jgi:hypothetical protein
LPLPFINLNTTFAIARNLASSDAASLSTAKACPATVQWQPELTDLLSALGLMLEPLPLDVAGWAPGHGEPPRRAGAA